jgi:NitT/TauT family transport system substrate-binding protein
MSDEEKAKVKEKINQSRRAFLKYAGAGVMFPTIIGILPSTPISGPLGWKAFAQSEKKISDDWWQLASKYGKPKGKFGKVGDPVTLTIGYQPYCTPYWTSSVNKQAQMWAKYLPKGSKTVWFRSLSGPLINNNMYAGKNQFGYMAETPAFRSGDTVDCDMVSVTGYDYGESGGICVRSDLLKDGKVKSPKDLNGQRFGTPFGSYSHRHALTFAYQNDIKPNLLDQSIELQVTNLRANNIWAAATWDPYPTWLEYRGIAERWVTGMDMPCTCTKYIPEAEEHTFRVVGSTLAIWDWLRDRPDIMAAYLKSEEECRDMLTNDMDLAAYYIWTDISEVPPAVVRVNLDMMIWDGRVTPECRNHLKGGARMWRDIKILSTKRTKDPDAYIDEWADDSFLMKAIQEMKAKGLWTSAQLPGFPKEIRPDQLKRHSWKTYEKINLQAKRWRQTRV